MRKAARLGGVTASVIVLLTAMTAPASAGTFAKATDFDGDNYRDLVIGAPGGENGDSAAASTYVTFGGKSGLATSRHARVDSTPVANSVPDLAVSGADFNSDGYADLVIGDPSKKGGTGGVTVIQGTSKGATGKVTAFAQGSAGVPGTANDQHHFGSYLAQGDFNGDSAPDLAIGASGDDGSVTILYGGSVGLTADQSQRLARTDGANYEGPLAACDLDNDGKTDLVANGTTRKDEEENPALQISVFRGSDDRLPTSPTMHIASGNGLSAPGAVACGDVSGDAYDDIVFTPVFGDLGGPTEPVKGGQIQVAYGSSGGLSDKRTTLSQGSTGVPGTSESGDDFGSSLAVGDVNHDGIADAAVGISGEAVGTVAGAGAVDVLYGGKNGLSGKGGQAVTQNTSGVPGAAEKSDRLGSAVTLVDLDANGTTELVAGVPGENEESGGVTVVRATSKGLTTTGSLTFGTKTLGHTSTGTRFGAVLAH